MCLTAIQPFFCFGIATWQLVNEPVNTIGVCAWSWYHVTACVWFKLVVAIHNERAHLMACRLGVGRTCLTLSLIRS